MSLILLSSQKKILQNYEISFNSRTLSSPFGLIIPIDKEIFTQIFPNASLSELNTIYEKKESDFVNSVIENPHISEESSFIRINRNISIPTAIFYNNAIILKRNLIISSYVDTIFYFSLYRPFAKLEQQFSPTKTFYLKIYEKIKKKDNSSSIKSFIVNAIIKQVGPKYVIYFSKNSLIINNMIKIEIFSSIKGTNPLIKRNVQLETLNLPKVFIIVNQNILKQYLNKRIAVFVKNTKISFKKIGNSKKNKYTNPNSLSNFLLVKPFSSISPSNSISSSKIISRLFFLGHLKYYSETKFFRCYIPSKIVNHASTLFSANLFSVALYDNGYRFYLKRYSLKSTSKQIFLYFRFSEDITSRIIRKMQKNGFIQVGIASSPGRLPEYFPNWKIPLLSFGLIVSYHIKGNNSLWIGISQKAMNLARKTLKENKINYQFIPIDFRYNRRFEDQTFKSEEMLLSGILKTRKDSGGWIYSSLRHDFPISSLKRNGIASLFLSYNSRCNISLNIFFSLDSEWSGHWIGFINIKSSDNLHFEYDQDLIIEFYQNNRNYESSGTYINFNGKDAIVFTERMPWFKKTFFREKVVVYSTMIT